MPGFHHFCALNFRQSAVITEICVIQVHTGTPHIFCLTITSLTCVRAHRYGVVRSMQVPHLYSVSTPLASYVYWWRNTHPKIIWIYGCMPGFYHFYVLNFLQSASITELCRIQVTWIRHSWTLNFRQSATRTELCVIQVHAGTTHILCLTTTTIIICVVV